MQSKAIYVGEVFFAFCKTLDTPISLGAWLRFKHGEFAQLVSMDIHPDWYDNAAAFAGDLQVVSFLRKNKALKTGINLEKVALQTFATFERLCQQTNERFRHLDSWLSPRETSLLHRMSRKISAILGPLDVRVMDGCRWGPGATLTLRSSECSQDNKHSEVPLSCTPEAWPYFRLCIESDPHWFESLYGILPEGPFSLLGSYSVAPGNRVVCVPKNAKTDRVIAAEPTGNSFLQQGVGRYLRSRLKRFGVNLDDQEINKVWASLAYDLDLCTIDLSGASDSIATLLLREVLPPDWFSFLDSIRSKSYCLKKQWFKANKFSSMGNAFTFELETVIFYSAVSAVCEEYDCGSIVSVYGDDIIAPRSAYPFIEEFFEFLGFKVNDDKSFSRGSFFESCGGQYYEGIDVTPFYQKEHYAPNIWHEAIRFHNRVYRALRRATKNSFGELSKALDSALSCIVRHLPDACRRLRIPDTDDGDEGLLSQFWELGDFCENHGFFCHVLRAIPERRPGRDTAFYALWLRNSATSKSSTAAAVAYDGWVYPRVARPRYKVRTRWIIPHEVLS